MDALYFGIYAFNLPTHCSIQMIYVHRFFKELTQCYEMRYAGEFIQSNFWNGLMAEFFSVYVYLGLVLCVTLLTLSLTALFSSRKTGKVKFMPYESGIQTETHLLTKRFPLRHYLVGLLFLVFDIEVIFLYPWAVVGKKLGHFAFYEMTFFLVVLLVGFAYIWKKKGLEWE